VTVAYSFYAALSSSPPVQLVSHLNASIAAHGFRHCSFFNRINLVVVLILIWAG
jgi:hypothetical protein